MKSVQRRSFFWSVFFLIPTECPNANAGKNSPNAGKNKPEKTPYLDTFHAK